MNTSQSLTDEATPLILAATPKPKTPLPRLQICIFMIVEVGEIIVSSSVSPYINQLVRELPITGGNAAAVGYYVGVVQSAFFLGRALTLFKWCQISDRIGRKPVALFGLSGTCISVLCFGLSTTFWSLVISRCMWGALNGNTGVMKTVMGELTDSTNMAKGFALIAITFYIGSFFGSLMGGALARPQDHWPELFAHPFWTTHPYFLPSASSDCILHLAHDQQTLPTKRRRKLTTTFGGANIDNREVSAQRSTENVPLKSLLTPSIVIPIANYTVLALLGACLRDALFPLFLSTPIHLGGLDLTPSSIGFWLASFGLANGIVQVLFFAKVADWLGPKRLFCVSVSFFAPAMIMFPVISWLVCARVLSDHGIVLMLLGQTGSDDRERKWHMVRRVITKQSAALMFVTAAAPASNVLGAINGLCQTSGAFARAVGPALATSLFALSKEYNLLNGNAVYVIFVLLAGALRWLASKLPSEIRDRDE